MAGTGTGAKKYVVKLSLEERERLEAVISSGKRSAQLITKARILLKADTSDAGEGWTDGEIAAALDTSVNTVGTSSNFRRRDGGQTDRPGLLAGSRGLRALEPTVARREGGRTGHRREGERQHDRTDSKKTLSNRTAIGNG